MLGFRWMARQFYNCQTLFFQSLPCLLRKKQSKGHGIHSPFAFHLITRVIYTQYTYYAFSDTKKLIEQEGLEAFLFGKFNDVSFRLVYYFQPKNILEINSGMGINTLFLMAAAPYARCTCVEGIKAYIETAVNLVKQRGVEGKCEIISTFPPSGEQKYDALFLNITEGIIPDIDVLLELSTADAFWVFHPIKKGVGKQFWHRIVHDERTRVTFDVGDTGIAFLKADYSKVNYLI